jgi:hypothetical protein
MARKLTGKTKNIRTGQRSSRDCRRRSVRFAASRIRLGERCLMKIPRSPMVLGFLIPALALSILVLVLLIAPRGRGPVFGTWTNSRAYQGAASGDISLVIEENGRVRVTAVAGSSLWWAADKYDLQLRGDTIEIRLGNQVSGQLLLKQRRGGLHLIDRSLPVESLSLRRANQLL